MSAIYSNSSSSDSSAIPIVQSYEGWIKTPGLLTGISLTTSIPSIIDNFKNSASNLDFQGIREGFLRILNTISGIALSIFSCLTLITKSLKLVWPFLKSLIWKILGGVYIGIEFIIEGMRLKNAIEFKVASKIPSSIKKIKAADQDNKTKELLTAIKGLYSKYVTFTTKDYLTLSRNTGNIHNEVEFKLLQVKRNKLGRQIGKKAARTFLIEAPIIIRNLQKSSGVNKVHFTDGIKLLKFTEKQSNKVLLVHTIGMLSLCITITIFVIGFISACPLAVLLGLAVIGIAFDSFRSYAIESYVENDKGWNFKAMLPNISCLKKYRNDERLTREFLPYK